MKLEINKKSINANAVHSILKRKRIVGGRKTEDGKEFHRLSV